MGLKKGSQPDLLTFNLPLYLAGTVLLLPLFFPYEQAFWLGVPGMTLAWIADKFYRKQKDWLCVKTGGYDDQYRLCAAIDGYVRALKDCTDQQTALCQRQLNQLSRIVSDAVSTLSESFDAIHTVIENRSDRAAADSGRSERNHGTQSEFAIDAESLGEVFRCFEKHVVEVDHIAALMTGTINCYTQHVDEAGKLIDVASNQTGQCRSLVNESCVRRAQGTDPTPGQTAKHIGIANQHAEKINALLDAVSISLEAARDTVESASVQNRNVMNSLKAFLEGRMRAKDISSQANSVSVGQIGSEHARIDRAVNDAMQGLQFEDIASQLINSLRLTLQHIQTMSDRVDIDLKVIESSDQASCIRQLEQGALRLADMRHQWRTGDLQVVTQSSMAEGGVELF